MRLPTRRRPHSRIVLALALASAVGGSVLPAVPAFGATAPAPASASASAAEAPASGAGAAGSTALGLSAEELPFPTVLAIALAAAGITAVGMVRRPRRD